MSWDEKKGAKAEKALIDWFTPSLPAVDNYVGRGVLDKKIYREFAQRGRQVLVYGPTGAGKTSMVLDNLKRLREQYKTNNIRVTMTNTTDITSFVAEVANKLDLKRDVQTTEADESNLGFKVGFKSLIGIGVDDKSSNQRVTERYTGTDDFSILEEVLFKTNTVLIVDDMENLSEKALPLRTRLAEIAKNMSDDAINYPNSYAKIVFVGIAATAEQLWEDVQSLKSRLATIKVPYLNNEESHEILANGWKDILLFR